jgi:hypothetical protein
MKWRARILWCIAVLTFSFKTAVETAATFQNLAYARRRASEVEGRGCGAFELTKTFFNPSKDGFWKIAATSVARRWVC